MPIFGPTFQSKVIVTNEGIEYQRSLGVGFKDKAEFSVPTAQIRTCNHRRAGLQFLNYGSHFVDVTVEQGGHEYVVQFKAVGMTKERDASKFYTAVNSLIAKGSPNG